MEHAIRARLGDGEVVMEKVESPQRTWLFRISIEELPAVIRRLSELHDRAMRAQLHGTYAPPLDGSTARASLRRGNSR